MDPHGHSDIEFAMEPDARTILANERTYLAWMRTSLGVLASGTALATVPLTAVEPGFRVAASLILLTAGILLPIQAWVAWRNVEKALRLGTALPSPVLIVPLTAAFVVAGGLVLIGSILS